jgi:hypothetical protein
MNINRWMKMLLLVPLLCLCGCGPSSKERNPLEGWTPARDLEKSRLNKLVQDDYRSYIQNLPQEEKNYVADIWIMKSNGGDLAVLITIPLNGTWWHHVLFYDKNYKRIKTVKYKAGDYQS